MPLPNTSSPASGCNSGVECLLPKQNVVGSNPITRSTATPRVSASLERRVNSVSAVTEALASIFERQPQVTTLQDAIAAYRTTIRADGKSEKTVIWVYDSVRY